MQIRSEFNVNKLQEMFKGNSSSKKKIIIDENLDPTKGRKNIKNSKYVGEF